MTTDERDFVDQQKRLHSVMQGRRKPQEGLMDEVCNMFTPELYQRPGGNSTTVQRWGEDLYDGYPQLCLHTWSKGIPGNMIYRYRPWFNLTLNVRELMVSPAVKTYCEQRTEQVIWALRRTNFYDVNPQFCRYAGAIGGYLFPLVDEANHTVEFYLEDPWYVWIERDIFGHLRRVHREVTKTIQEWADEFGESALEASRRAALKTAPLTEFTVLHCLFPNPDWQPAALDVTRKRYAECYIDLGRSHLMKYGGVDYLPIEWAVERAPRQVYPLTPAMFALTDAYGADSLSESLYQVAREAGDPHMRISASLKDDYEYGPGARTWVTDAQEIVEQVRKRNDWPVGNEERQSIYDRLKRWFSVEYFELLSTIQGNPPTAYHIQQLQVEKATLLGPQVGTYQAQVLDTAVDIVSEVEDQYEHIKFPTELWEWLAQNAVKELQRQGYEVGPDQIFAYMKKYPSAWTEAKYTGVLTEIQGQMVHARRYGDGLAILQEMMPLWPEVKNLISPYSVARNILEAANWSQEDLHTEDDYNRAVDDMQKREDLVLQAQLEEAGAKAYKQLTRAPEKGSPAEVEGAAA